MGLEPPAIRFACPEGHDHGGIPGRTDCIKMSPLPVHRIVKPPALLTRPTLLLSYLTLRALSVCYRSRGLHPEMDGSAPWPRCL